MKKILLPLLISIFSCFESNAQTLSAGDIAFIGMNTDTQEGYTFITLAAIPSSEEILLY